jgi:uncharacterized membrane protein YraQ (UPF0718 family)
MASRKVIYGIIILILAAVSIFDILYYGGKLTNAGVVALTDYVSAHVATCLIPAFFISGAIAALISKESVLKYFGADTKKVLAYSVAAVSGAILAVCSCTILPLFAGIRRKGAGLGPAITFLFSGPAINVLAIFYSAQLLGWDLGLARAIVSVAMSVWIGLIMAFLFKKSEEREVSRRTTVKSTQKANPEHRLSLRSIRNPLFLILQVLILIIGTAQFLSFQTKIIGIIILIAGVLLSLKLWFTRSEIMVWLRETLNITELIFPILLIGVYIAGWLTVLIPQQIVGQYLGGNSFSANLIASVIGAVMYFATLTEVPIVKSLMILGMGRGPALALLLAGPSLSLPSMIVITRIMGLKKTACYVTLVVLIATLAGLLFGLI